MVKYMTCELQLIVNSSNDDEIVSRKIENSLPKKKKKISIDY